MERVWSNKSDNGPYSYISDEHEQTVKKDRKDTKDGWQTGEALRDSAAPARDWKGGASRRGWRAGRSSERCSRPEEAALMTGSLGAVVQNAGVKERQGFPVSLTRTRVMETKK